MQDSKVMTIGSKSQLKKAGGFADFKTECEEIKNARKTSKI
jgi:hypothetical protein